MTGRTDTARLIFELVRRRRGADPFVFRAKTALASDDIGSKSPRCGHGGLSSLDDPLTTRRFCGDGIGWRPRPGMQPVWAQSRTCPASHEIHAACNSWIEAGWSSVKPPRALAWQPDFVPQVAFEWNKIIVLRSLIGMNRTLFGSVGRVLRRTMATLWALCLPGDATACATGREQGLQEPARGYGTGNPRFGQSGGLRRRRWARSSRRFRPDP